MKVYKGTDIIRNLRHSIANFSGFYITPTSHGLHFARQDGGFASMNFFNAAAAAVVVAEEVVGVEVVVVMALMVVAVKVAVVIVVVVINGSRLRSSNSSSTNNSTSHRRRRSAVVVVSAASMLPRDYNETLFGVLADGYQDYITNGHPLTQTTTPKPPLWVIFSPDLLGTHGHEPLADALVPWLWLNFAFRDVAWA